MEFNAGVVPNMQFHIVLPFTLSLPEDGPKAYGLGDTEIGIKYRFIQETAGAPMVGVFPMAELPSGTASRGLGNGKTWEKLPVWVQKSWGPWTTYGGMGYAVNSAQGAKNYLFGGWLLQKRLSPKLTLGGEIFAQGATMENERASGIINIGGYYNFSKSMSLLFSGGSSVIGERHLVGYLGLYWTWSAAKK